MYKCEREDEIIALLTETEYATVDYLVRKINISASSIRRDLKNLEERGLVVRSYGGVKLANSLGKQIPFSLRHLLLPLSVNFPFLQFSRLGSI